MSRPLVLALLLVAGSAGGAQDGTPGGTSASRGLRWLLQAQNRDGSWGLDAATPSDITCTSIAALALMAGGNTERGGPDPESVAAVRKAVGFVAKRVDRTRGDFSQGQQTLPQRKLGAQVDSFFAAVLLSQTFGQRGVWGSVELEDFKDHISVLVRRILKTQESDGSWNKETFGSLKGTCMAWLALRAASSVGLDVEKAPLRKIIALVLQQYNPASKLFDKMNRDGGYQAIYSTGSCLRVLYGMGQGNSCQAREATDAFMNYVKTPQNGAAYLTVEGEDYLSAALMSQALLIEQDERWRIWSPWITGELEKRQAKDGSWTTTACISGRTFATACAVLALQTHARLLPIFEL